MKNIDVLSGIIIEWAKPMVDDIATNVIGAKLDTANAWVKKYFPVSANYNLWNDLSFFAIPIVSTIITPILTNAISSLGLNDEDIPKYAHSVVDSMLEEVEKKGSVTFFERYTFSKDDIKRLKELLNKNFIE